MALILSPHKANEYPFNGNRVRGDVSHRLQLVICNAQSVADRICTRNIRTIMRASSRIRARCGELLSAVCDPCADPHPQPWPSMRILIFGSCRGVISDFFFVGRATHRADYRMTNNKYTFFTRPMLLCSKFWNRYLKRVTCKRSTTHSE